MDEHLRQTLRLHGADILEFNTDSVHDASADQTAILVHICDGTVGVVLLRKYGHTALVLLDYVTLLYRIFSPGEVHPAPQRTGRRPRHPACRHSSQHDRRER